MTDTQNNQETQKQGDSRYITKWTLLIIAGCIVEFLARFIGYDNNPTPLYLPIIPAATSILSLLIVLFGYHKVTQGNTKQNVMTKRTGIMLIAMGLIMFASFMVFRLVMPLIFG